MEYGEEYYQGRESVWKELYKEVCQVAGEAQLELEELRKRIFHEGEDRKMIANMTSQIDGLNQKIEVMESSNLTLQKECYAILTDVMNISNASAEERLSYMRSHYKQQYVHLAKVVGK